MHWLMLRNANDYNVMYMIVLKPNMYIIYNLVQALTCLCQILLHVIIYFRTPGGRARNVYSNFNGKYYNSKYSVNIYIYFGIFDV